MQNKFGEKIAELRRVKFPGISLRKVGELLAEEHDFPKFFYTQLNKFEMGITLPSSELLVKLLNAYKASQNEKMEIVQTYAEQVATEKVRMVAEDTNVDHGKLESVVFYRKRDKK